MFGIVGLVAMAVLSAGRSANLNMRTASSKRSTTLVEVVKVSAPVSSNRDQSLDGARDGSTVWRPRILAVL